MNEKTLTDHFDWDDLKLFLAVARSGGLSAACATTGKSAPTLGRRMLALEAITGSELFNRFARGYELTEQGALLFEKVILLEAQIQSLDRASDANSQVLVKVSAGSWVTHILCQQIQTILAANNAARLRFISDDNVLSISHRETIIGIRNARPQQNELACRKLGRVQFAGYAASKAIKPWIRVLGKTPSAKWLAAQAHDNTCLEVTTPRNALDLAHTGVGRALLPTFIGEQQKDLVRVTKPVSELAHDQWLVTHQEERFKPEVRQIIDRIVTQIKAVHQSSRS